MFIYNTYTFFTEFFPFGIKLCISLQEVRLWRYAVTTCPLTCLSFVTCHSLLLVGIFMSIKNFTPRKSSKTPRQNLNIFFFTLFSSWMPASQNSGWGRLLADLYDQLFNFASTPFLTETFGSTRSLCFSLLQLSPVSRCSLWPPSLRFNVAEFIKSYFDVD